MALVKSIYIEIYIFINYNDEKNLNKKKRGELTQNKTKRNKENKLTYTIIINALLKHKNQTEYYIEFR